MSAQAQQFVADQSTWTPRVTGDPVPVDGGLIAGIWRANASVRAYLGIPYAAPPLAELRWKAPQPVVPWTGIRAAHQIGPQPMQRHQRQDSLRYETYGDQEQSEDCLTMNVWAPSVEPRAKLPVIVWIYGGAYQRGSSGNATFDGTNLAQRGVVVVSFNYRVGILGFLAHPELTAESQHSASGNYGLLDQIAALEWIKRNIGKFGGDPDNITIFGQSAGAGSVSMLMASPLSQGLFHRAIACSFGYLKTVKPLAVAEAAGAEFAQQMDARSISELRQVPAEQIVGSRVAAWPIVDGYFLPESPDAIYRAGREAAVPLITGWNADEGTKFPVTPTKAGFVASVREVFGEDADEVLSLFPVETDEDAVTASLEMRRDELFATAAFRMAQVHASNGKPVFLYHFTRRSPFYAAQKFCEIEPASRFGAYHGAEVPYIFGTLDILDRHFEDVDRQLSTLLQSYWINFARSGNPNGPGLPEWPVYPGGRDQVLHIGDQTEVGSVPRIERLELFDRLNVNPERNVAG
jgi:para-nitrobenzyl esterase